MNDCIVIGAGFSGLCAAEQLVLAGLDVLVLETRDVVGGRVRNETFEGQLVELGARYFGDDQTEVMALLERFKLTKQPAIRHGEAVLHDGQKQTVVSYEQLEADVPQAVYEKLEAMVAKLDSGALLDHAEARDWDKLSLADWLRGKGVSETGIKEMNGFCHGLLSSEAEDVSLLSFLWYAAGSGSLFHAVDYEAGLLKYTAEETLHAIAQGLADALGERVKTNVTVQAISRRDGHLEVIAGETRYLTKNVIFALPPTALATIQLPADVMTGQKGILEGFSLGNAFACFAVFDRPFWRERGLSGTGMGQGWVSTTFDVSNAAHSEGILDCMISPTKSHAFAELSVDEQKKAVLEDIRAYFGDASVTPEAIFVANWHDEAPTKGAFGWRLDPGFLTRNFEALQHSYDHIYFAGTERAKAFPGYVEGAIRAGREVAAEVLKG